MKKIRLTESELTKLIKDIVNETQSKKNVREEFENFINPEAMETGDAILTIIGTVIGMLGIAGYDILKDMAKKLMKQGKKQEARQIMDYVGEHERENDRMMDDKEERMMESRIARRRRR
jgi:polyhydroxyalkanoate synthesis regulator phasin